MWRDTDPCGRESAKVRFDLVPYMRGRILDLGSGEEKVFPIAIGIDNKIDAKLFGIEVKPDIPVKTCEEMEWLSDESADVIFSSHLLEHIANYEGALKEWWRILEFGGHLILYLPNNEDTVENGGYPKMGEPGANPDHKWDVSYDKVVQAIYKCGAFDLEVFEKRKQDTEYSLLFIFKKLDNGQHNYSHRNPKSEQKTLGIVRLGAYGDALWMTSLLPQWKEEGYHITVYTQPSGEEVLRHDPNIDKIICQPHGLFEFGDGKIGMWQTAYWLHEEKKYDKFVNLIGSTERRLLPQPFDPDFYLPFEQRHRMMNRNYHEALHEWAGVPFGKHWPKFYPTIEEDFWAREERSKIDGPLVIINPAGSSVPKWWPYAQELADLLAGEDIHVRILGDTRWAKFRESKRVKVLGTTLPIRKAFAFAAMADVVVGTESAIINSVAFETPLKVVLLSHSTHENLTRDWFNTLAIEPEGVSCYPCHRIHTDMAHCMVVKQVGAAACQAAASAEQVFQAIKEYLARPMTYTTDPVTDPKIGFNPLVA